MKKYLTILFLMAFILPSVALASWWNPFSWFSNWNFIKKETVPQVRVETQKNLEDKINESQGQPDDLKNQESASATTDSSVKESKKTVSSSNSAFIQEQVRIQTEATLRAKAEQDALIAKQKEVENQSRIDALKAELEKQSKELEQINENVDRISKNTDEIVQNTAKAPEPVQIPDPVREIKINAEEIGVSKPKTFESVKVGEEFAIRVEILEDEKPLKQEPFTISVNGERIYTDRSLTTNYTIGQSGVIWYSIVAYTAQKEGKHTIEVKSGDIINSIEVTAE